MLNIIWNDLTTYCNFHLIKTLNLSFNIRVGSGRKWRMLSGPLYTQIINLYKNVWDYLLDWSFCLYAATFSSKEKLFTDFTSIAVKAWKDSRLDEILFLHNWTSFAWQFLRPFCFFKGETKHRVLNPIRFQYSAKVRTSGLSNKYSVLELTET